MTAFHISAVDFIKYIEESAGGVVRGRKKIFRWLRPEKSI